MMHEKLNNEKLIDRQLNQQTLLERNKHKLEKFQVAYDEVSLP